MVADTPGFDTIFCSAIEIDSADERAAYIARTCGDNQELRLRVEKLVAAHFRAGQFLEPPARAPDATIDEPIREGPGTVIGPYKLLQQIGEGGFGVVFMAEQEKPVRRTVALKIIKPGMDTAQVIARFESERQALAMMDHPNIARVLDAGATDTGRPFFVMELVKGVPITEFCDKNHMPPEARLKLFIDVCHAIQHAHHKGIIHRDIKPSNVMVTLHDGVPVVKVIDFGVAKATLQKLTERTLFTAYGQMIGTPAYMSPEQAEMSGLDIDTRSDIYALGVLLYELLTGTTPLDSKRLREAGYAEMQRLIRDEEAPRPSTRLSSLGDSATIFAGNRGTDPKQLARLLAGDLDWIVMKALDKDRNRRYGTPSNFAEDVERYLRREAILARPPSTAYKLKKFAQRNRAAVLTAAAVAAALLVGTTVATWQAVVATRARASALAALDEKEQARQAEAEQRQRAETNEQKAIASAAAEKEAKETAEAEKQKAEKAESDTLADYRASTDDAIEQLIGSKPELGPKEKTYLENTLKRWQAFAARKGDDEHSQAIRGEGYFRVAYVWQRLGRREESLSAYQAARDIRKKLVEQFPAVPAYQQGLANTHGNLGMMLVEVGKGEQAWAEYQEAREIFKKLVEQFPAVPAYQQGLSNTHNNLGNLLADLGKREEARGEYEAARDIRKKLVEQFPAVPAYQQGLATTHHNLGNRLADLGKREEARAESQAARDIFIKLVEQFPAVPEYQQGLATTHNSLGNLLDDLGKREEAWAEYEAARDIHKKLVEQFPTVPAYQQGLSDAHECLGILLARLGKHEEAWAEYQAGRDIKKKLVEQFPAVPRYQINLGGSYCNYGNLILREGKPAESLEWFDLAIRTLKPVHDQESRDVTAKEFLRNSHSGRAVAYDQLQRFAEAAKDWDRAIELSSLAEQPGRRARRATSRVQAGLVAEAVAEVAELTAPRANATGLANWNADQWYDFACVYAVASGKIADKKQEYADRAMELLQQAVKAGFKNAAHIAKDIDLDALRDREDFKNLLADLAVPKATENKPMKP